MVGGRRRDSLADIGQNLEVGHAKTLPGRLSFKTDFLGSSLLPEGREENGGRDRD